MTTLAWIMVICFIILLIGSLFIWHEIDEDSLPINLMLSLAMVLIVLVFSCEVEQKNTTDKINSQYISKTKVTITSDSTYHIDTLYYIKVKPKTK